MGLGEAPLNTRDIPENKEPIFCDDCGQEKMAEIRDGKIVIVDRRHGRQHVAIVDVIKIGNKVRSARTRRQTPSP